MDKIKAVIEVSEPDEDDLWNAHIEYFGKDSANLWEFRVDATYYSTDDPSDQHYSALAAEFPSNGADVENPFM